MAMSPRLLRPVASGFDPRRIADLSVWMDASTASTYTESSGQITEWRSRVGSLKFEQTTANNRPTLFESSSDVQGATAAVINGRPAMYFDGTNDELIGSATISGTQWTAFAVCRSDSVTAVRGFFSRDQGSALGIISTRGPQFLRHNNSAAVQSVAFDAAGAFVPSAGSMTSGVAAVIHAVQSASTIQVFLNNVGGTAISGSQNSNATTPRIGNTTPAAEFWRGTVGEILLYDRALTTGEQSKVYQYLRSRWGIA